MANIFFSSFDLLLTIGCHKSTHYKSYITASFKVCLLPFHFSRFKKQVMEITSQWMSLGGFWIHAIFSSGTSEAVCLECMWLSLFFLFLSLKEKKEGTLIDIQNTWQPYLLICKRLLNLIFHVNKSGSKGYAVFIDSTTSVKTSP